MTEIERKFLVQAEPGDLAIESRERIAQGYLAVASDGSEVRVRAIGDRFRLTVKSGGGEVRDESEVAISKALFEELWPLTEGRRVTKERLRIPYRGRTIELDIYDGELSGLRVAEVEFGSVEESRDFDPPPWFGPEVTGRGAFKNQTLAREGMPADVPLAKPP